MIPFSNLCTPACILNKWTRTVSNTFNWLEHTCGHYEQLTCILIFWNDYRRTIGIGNYSGGPWSSSEATQRTSGLLATNGDEGTLKELGGVTYTEHWESWEQEPCPEGVPAGSTGDTTTSSSSSRQGSLLSADWTNTGLANGEPISSWGSQLVRDGEEVLTPGVGPFTGPFPWGPLTCWWHWPLSRYTWGA